MKSTDMNLDVTLATGFTTPTHIAATLHLPDGMERRPEQLIFAIHGGGYSRHYWHPPFADDSYSFARWFTDSGKAVLTIDMLGMGDSQSPCRGFAASDCRLGRAGWCYRGWSFDGRDDDYRPSCR
jgi:pimeloyl-ACP methyl ester carboxylesterase